MPLSSPSHDPSRSLRADLVLASVTTLWGMTFVVVADALQRSDALSFLAMRFFVGALATTAVARRKVLEPKTLRAGLILAVFLFLGFLLQTVGLIYTTPSRS